MMLEIMRKIRPFAILLIVFALFPAACTPATIPIPIVTQTPSTSPIMAPVITPGTTVIIPQRTIPPPSPPPNVFVDESKTINVDVGERFIIRYDYFRNMFGHFEGIAYPDDIVVSLGQELNTAGPGPVPVDGVVWFYFQATKPGYTRITVKEFGHLMQIAPTNQKTFLVNVGKQDPSTIPPPGKSANESARVLYSANSVDLKAGENTSIDVTLETRKDGPGWFFCKIFRTDKDGNNTLTMPAGLVVSLDPQNTPAYPNNTYHTTINIKTSPDLAAGEYWLRFEGDFEQVIKTTGLILVTVK